LPTATRAPSEKVGTLDILCGITSSDLTFENFLPRAPLAPAAQPAPDPACAAGAAVENVALLPLLRVRSPLLPATAVEAHATAVAAPATAVAASVFFPMPLPLPLPPRQAGAATSNGM